MTTFYLIRHGEKMRDEIMVGREPGVHLTANGQRQARRLAAYLKKTGITHIFSSPLERALDTIQPLAALKKLTVEARAAFHEVDMGQWTGQPKAKVQRTPAWHRYCRFPGGTSIPGGETLAEVQARMVSEIVRLSETLPDREVAIATHEDPIRVTICHFIGAPINVFEHITVRFGSITILRLDKERAVLELMDVLPPGDPRLEMSRRSTA